MIRLIILSAVYALNFWACGQVNNFDSGNKSAVSESNNKQAQESANKTIKKPAQTFKGSVTAGEGNEILYIFQAKPNKTLMVKIKSEANNAIFSVNEQYRVDREAIEVDGNPVKNIRDEWTGKLPENQSQGLYSVAVTSTKGVAKFTVEISLEGGGKIDVKNSDETAETNDESEKVETNTDEIGPQTAEQFYLLMPKKYDGKSAAERKDLAETAHQDEEIAYTNYLRGSMRAGAIETFEAAIFENPGGGYIFAYNEDYNEYSNPSPTKLFFLSYENEKWTDVTAQVMPIPINKKYQYTLPREGETIEVSKDGLEKSYSLVWENGKFIKSTN